jgi:mannose-1-phosphate guanylyltransferase/phosphomannomutase
MSPRSLTDAAVRKDIIFAGAQGGGFIFPHFMPAYDALLSLCKLVEMRVKAGESLSSLIDSLPKCHLAQRNIFCSWDHRGPVMRSLAEGAKGKDVDFLDGLKIFAQDGWVLIVPDPEELVLKIYAESGSHKKAEQQIVKIVDLINRYVIQ